MKKLEEGKNQVNSLGDKVEIPNDVSIKCVRSLMPRQLKEKPKAESHYFRSIFRSQFEKRKQKNSGKSSAAALSVDSSIDVSSLKQSKTIETVKK